MFETFLDLTLKKKNFSYFSLLKVLLFKMTLRVKYFQPN